MASAISLTRGRRRPIDAFALTGRPNWAKLTPGRSFGDLLNKPWIEGVVPVLLAVAISVALAASTPGLLQSGDQRLILQHFAELGFVAVGLTVVIIAGGIDLSVAAIVGMTAMTSLVMFRVYELPVGLIIVLTLLVGALLGTVNGVLIAFVRTRPFITTLVTGVAFRALVSVIQTEYNEELIVPREDLVWSFIGNGTVLGGVATSVATFVPVLVLVHLMLTRSRWGWWVTAIGSDRRSSRRNGIPSARVQFGTYVFSGLMCALAGLVIAARQGSTSAQVGDGLEIAALTAVVLGGVSLTGGRGSVLRAGIGVLVVSVISQALIRRASDEAWNTLILAACLLGFAVLDMKWGKYRTRIAEKLAVAPLRLDMGPLTDVTRPGTPWTVNRHLTDAPPIGLGEIEGAEDCAVDADGNVYCGDRRGWIWRFPAGQVSNGEIFARTGGSPLGFAWDREGRLLVCVIGIGLCRIGSSGEVEHLAVQTKRSRTKVYDDSVIGFADDLDVAADGCIYFSDASTRLKTADYNAEVAEYRPNGRVLRYDPADGSVETIIENHSISNGIVTAHDGMSILIASSGLFRVDRYWIAGPKAGQLEPVLENLPGLPDNLNRASDGNYWMSFAGMRTPISDVFLRHPRLRRRMMKELPADDWIVPQWNVSCVAKFSEDGTVLRSFWDETLERYPLITSMKEHDGHLYLGGIQNNRIGRFVLPPEEVGPIDPARVPGTVSAHRTGGTVLAR